MKGFPWNLVLAQGVPNASTMGLLDGRKSFKVGLVVLIQYRLWQTDSQPASHVTVAYYVARVMTKGNKKLS